MKKLSKILSAGLSLTLCAALVVPSFAAATFADLQSVINSRESYTYENEEGATVTGISYDTATDTVKLHEEVKYESGDPETIVINSGKNVILDLNGNNIDGQGKSSSVITVNQGGGLTLKDSTARVEKDEDGNETYVSGKITGGYDANWNGGGVDNAGRFTMESGAISDNKANYGGGVTNQSTGTFIMDGGVISDNSANSGGGVRNLGTFTMNGGAIDGNKSPGYGGGVFNETDSTFTMAGGSISNNKANVGNTSTTEGYSGGGIANNGTFTMTGGVIEGNSAYRGGGIRNDGTATVSGSAVIRNNTASNSGGGIDSSGTLTMTGGTISGNTAGTVGGGIDASGTVALTKVAMTNNTSAGSGGALYVRDTDDATLKNVTMTNNTAANSGGAITVVNSNAKLNNVTMTDNTAARGGALWVGGDATLTNVTMIGNSANSHGGALFMNKGSVTLEGTIMTGNTAGNQGGGIAAGASTVTFQGSNKIRNNTAAVAGDDILAITSAVFKDFSGDWLWDNVEDREPDKEKTVYEISEDGSFAERTCLVFGGVDEDDDNGAEDIPTPVTTPTVEIDDVDVPLAGLFTRADAIGYLWKQAGSPEWELSEFLDVPEDHQWAVAIGWAEDMGIAVADEDGNFRPDDLVLRYVEDLEIDPEGEFEEFLNRYAVYAGIKLDEGELFYKLGGAADDIVMGEEAQEIFNSFFAKLEAALGQAA